ncbi:hypothetical protein [Streptomyces sp. NPDC088752]|uniref:hypothetical protein n=1 Tax=Streptomyces sp. NPDC088752 TaxID=3154963 RepID=UPI00342E9787
MSSASVVRPASERGVRELIDDSYTFTFGQAAEWLGISRRDIDLLVQRSLVNAQHGAKGPLVVLKNQGVTLQSVFAYRRKLTGSQSS